MAESELLAAVGRQSGHCIACKTDVIVGIHDRRCPNCGQEVHPLSLARVDRAQDAPTAVSVVNALDSPPVPATRTPVVLPPVDDIVKWRRETVWRRDRLIEREAELLEELRGVRLGRKALDQVLGAVQIREESEAAHD